MAGSVIISGQLTGVPSGTLNVGPFTVQANTSDLYTEFTYLFVSGPNTVSVPDWSSGVIIVPSTVNTVALYLKGATGDTGIPLGLVQPSLINFPSSPPTDIYISAAFNMTTQTTFMYF